jgi:hypothetical protein
MILGFSHLTHATTSAVDAVAAWEAQGWTRSWMAAGIDSAPEKWPLMERHARLHDLHFLEGPVRVEVISHDTGSVAAAARLGISADRRFIEVRARDSELEKAFFCTALRCVQQQDGSLALAARIPSWSVAIRIQEDADAPLDPPLDVDGLSCLAFLSTSPEADAEAMIACGGRSVTPPFRLSVNGRQLKVLMLRSPEGTLIELVKIETSQ